MEATDLAIRVGDAVAYYLSVREKHEEARSLCDDHDWGYWGHEHQKELTRAAEELAQALDAFHGRPGTPGLSPTEIEWLKDAVDYTSPTHPARNINL